MARSKGRKTRFDFEDMKIPGVIYVLEFERPIGNPNSPRNQARHYLGWSKKGGLEERLEAHRTGRGAAITRAFFKQGIGFEVILLMPGTRTDEARYKQAHGGIAGFVQRQRNKVKRQLWNVRS